MIIHLNGWPGVGKQTVGSLLARKLEARFIHNHLLHDIAIICAGSNVESRWTLYESIRSAAYSAFAKQSLPENYAMTNALCKNAPREQMAWRHVVELAMARKTALIPVVLEAAEHELFQRLQSPDRTGRKPSNPAELRGYMKLDAIQKPDVPELLVLDVTEVRPEEAALKIVDFVATVKPSLRPASQRHLQMKNTSG